MFTKMQDCMKHLLRVHKPICAADWESLLIEDLLWDEMRPHPKWPHRVRRIFLSPPRYPFRNPWLRQ